MSGLFAIGNKVKELGHLHVRDMAEWTRRPAGFMQSSGQGIASAERCGYHIGRALFPEMCGVGPLPAEDGFDIVCRKPTGGCIEKCYPDLGLRQRSNRGNDKTTPTRGIGGFGYFLHRIVSTEYMLLYAPRQRQGFRVSVGLDA